MVPVHHFGRLIDLAALTVVITVMTVILSAVTIILATMTVVITFYRSCIMLLRSMHVLRVFIVMYKVFFLFVRPVCRIEIVMFDHFLALCLLGVELWVVAMLVLLELIHPACSL